MISGKGITEHLEVFSKNQMRKWIKNAPKTINQIVTKQQLYIIYKLIANRQAFRFSFKGIVKNLLGNLRSNCFRSCCCCLQNGKRLKQKR